MKLISVINQLRRGELSKLSLGTEVDHAALIPHINLGLAALHTRFPLRMESVHVQMYAHISEYILDSKYAQSNVSSSEPCKYIVDTPSNPYTDDIIKIEQVFDELGIDIGLNNQLNPTSVYTPNYNTVQVPFPNEDSSLYVTYRANHPTIPEDVDPNTFEIEISHSYLEALLYFVAQRVNSVMPSLDGQNSSTTFMMKYENACAILERHHVLHKDEPTNMKLRDNGWV